jgi:predicted outer membrane repeat protein
MNKTRPNPERPRNATNFPLKSPRQNGFGAARRALIALFACVAILASASAQTFKCGTIVGETWTKAGSPYIATCDILVAGLTIEPGVQVLMDGNFVFEVGGILTALGTEAEPITFTRTNGGWQGIFFNFSPAGSELRHCAVSNAVNSGVRIVNSAPPVFRHCLFANNTAPGTGGGINATLPSGDLLLEHCTFSNNASASHGGGIAAVMSSGTLRMHSCQIIGNRANPSIINGNYVGGGVYMTGNFELLNSLVRSNTSFSRCSSSFDCTVLGRGGGIYIASGTAVVQNCFIRENNIRADNAGNCNFGGSSQSLGSGIFLNAGNLTVRNSIFTQNSLTSASCGLLERGSCVYVAGGTCALVNVTCAYNNDGEAIYRAGGTLGVTNSIVYFNSGGQIGGSVAVEHSNVQVGGATPFPGTGNIAVNPLFQSTSNLIIVSLSPCVDAGSPDPIYNDVCFPPSFGTTRNDMGAHGGLGACCWDAPCEGPFLAPLAGQSSCLGQSAAFCVRATGAQPLSYQWRFHGTNAANPAVDIAGQTNSCLSLTNLTGGDAGFYSVRVSNAFGNTDSSPASLVLSDGCIDIRMYAGLTISGMAGGTYLLRYTTSLNDPITWTPLATNTLGSSNWFYLDLESPFSPHRFYRVDLVP